MVCDHWSPELLVIHHHSVIYDHDHTQIKLSLYLKTIHPNQLFSMYKQ